MRLWRLFLVLFRCLYGSHCGHVRSSFFYMMCDSTITGNVSSTRTITTELGCAYVCVSLGNCNVARYNSTELTTTGITTCFVYHDVDITSLSTDADDCILLKPSVVNGTLLETAVDVILLQSSTEQSTTDDVTVELTTTTESTTTVPNQITIIGAVDGLKQRCAANSGYDITILTSQGVYTYDNYASLSQGPCRSVESFPDVFVGYPSLPVITDVDAIMSHQNDFVDLFANGQVWRWQTINPLLIQTGYPKPLETHLHETTVPFAFDLTSLLFTAVQWGTNREKYGGIQRYFYTSSNTFKYYHANVPEYQEFTANGGDILNQNGQNINIWSQLPADVADVCRDPDESDNYVVFTNNGNNYKYTVDYTSNLNNPPVSLSEPQITVFDMS